VAATIRRRRPPATIGPPTRRETKTWSPPRPGPFGGPPSRLPRPGTGARASLSREDGGRAAIPGHDTLRPRSTSHSHPLSLAPRCNRRRDGRHPCRHWIPSPPRVQTRNGLRRMFFCRP
jgi:hypothetical protein